MTTERTTQDSVRVRILYQTRRGAGVMRFCDFADLPDQMRRLFQARIEARAELNGCTIGESFRDFSRGWTWWCEIEGAGK